jgi:hypothetical protein
LLWTTLLAQPDALLERWPASPDHPFRRSAQALAPPYEGPAGLYAGRRDRVFPEFEAFEYTPHFRNATSHVLPLSSVQALEATFGPLVLDGLTVVSAGAGSPDGVFPPDAYALRRRWFGPAQPASGRVVLRAPGDLPFWFLDNPQLQAGLFVAVGGGGRWEAAITVDREKGRLTVRTGDPNLNLRLGPGQEISGPTILLGAYRGPLWAGSNRLRRLLRTHYTPEALRRFHDFRFHDAPRDPHIARFQLHGLSHFVPAGHAGAALIWPSGARLPDAVRLLDEDFYPLAPQAHTLDAWDAWQFHDPRTDEGFVQAFRLQSAEEFRQFRLHGLTSGAPYRFRDPYTGEEVRLTGAQALEEGLGFRLPPQSSRIFLYDRPDRLKERPPRLAGN